MSNYDIVVVGASAGGVQALMQLVRSLPADFPAAICVVLHVGAAKESYLPKILARTGKLPATHAKDGEALHPGHIYVAPPDHHILIENGIIRLSQGPKEQHARPAIDPLFRSAAETYGQRVIGILLSGRLKNGTAGLRAIQQCGGVIIVQDPKTALHPDMPANALRQIAVDHVLPLSEIGPFLVRLVQGQMEEENIDPATEVDPYVDSFMPIPSGQAMTS